MTVNRLVLGDNLEIMKSMENESVDLIYLDPPFFSNRNYEVIWGDTGEIRSFQDRWAGGISHYIEWLKERVIEMHRVLKPTGSIFLHCDWHADAYIRVDIMDKIFGEKNFRNEIIWCYTAPANVKNRFPQKHDVIYFYSKSKNYYFTSDHVKIPYNQETVARTNRGAGGSGLKVKGDAEERHKNRLDKDGKVPEDYWIDIPRIQGNGSERIGYPTQKPEALMERIIQCASKKGDIVLDPFVGGGTTLAVADRLNRQWIGIDQSPMALKVSDFRLQRQADFFTAPYTVQLYKYDYDTLRYKDAFEFESWIIQQFGGTGNLKQRSDKGIDGKTVDGTPIQVKRSDNVSREVIDKFPTAALRYDKNLYSKNQKAKKPIGYIIAFSFGKGAVEETARLKSKDNIIIKLVKVDEIIPIAVKPVIGIHVNELERDESNCLSAEGRKIEFIAQGQSPAGIEFYSWDFAYDKDKGFKPSVIIDKEGRQILTLKAGTHNIAVKVVDNDGLENTDTVELKINGAIEKVK